MRMTVGRTRGDDEEGCLEYNGATLKFSYNRNAISYREWRKLRAKITQAQAEPNNPEHDWIVPSLLSMLTGWDLVASESDKKPLAISEETLEQLPPLFLIEILNTIWAASLPPVTPELDSGSFS